jgi:hypothetical protein
MQVDLSDVLNLKFPVKVNGREYKRPTMFLGAFAPRLTFRSPNDVLIELIVLDEYVIAFDVDGVAIGGCQNTDEITDLKLRALIEQALNDLKGEEMRLDPSHRKAKAAAQEAAAAAKEIRRQQALDKL